MILKDIKAPYPLKIKTEDVRNKLLESLGVRKISKKVDYSMQTFIDDDKELDIYHIGFLNTLQEAVNAVLCIPKNFSHMNKAGIVCLPGTNGSAEVISNKKFYRNNHFNGQLFGWARELSRRGYATLSISVWGCIDRQIKLSFDHQLQTKFLAPYGITGMGLGVEEALMGVNILKDILSVESCRIGVTGFSLGGNITWYSMACDADIKTAVAMCGGLGSMEEVIKAAYGQDGDPHRHGHYYFIPQMLRFFDHPDIIKACIFPRPFMMIAPKYDEDMPQAGVEKLMNEVIPLYVESGKAGIFKVYQAEGNHVFLYEYFEHMFQWFDYIFTKNV